jgi:hypothetical protein
MVMDLILDLKFKGFMCIGLGLKIRNYRVLFLGIKFVFRAEDS